MSLLKGTTPQKNNQTPPPALTTLTLHQELTRFHWRMKQNPLPYVSHGVCASPRVDHKASESSEGSLRSCLASWCVIHSQEEDGVDNEEGGI